MWPPSQAQRGVNSEQLWQMPSSQLRPQPPSQLQSGAALHVLQGNLRRSSRHTRAPLLQTWKCSTLSP